jgi:hypothetical protein
LDGPERKQGEEEGHREQKAPNLAPRPFKTPSPALFRGGLVEKGETEDDEEEDETEAGAEGHEELGADRRRETEAAGEGLDKGGEEGLARLRAHGQGAEGQGRESEEGKGEALCDALWLHARSA